MIRKMTKLIIRWAVRSTAAILLLVMILGGALLLTLATETGTRFVLQGAQYLFPETIQVQSAQGKFTGPLNITGFQLKTGTLDLTLDQFKINWQPFKLFQKKFIVDEIWLKGVRYTQPGPAEIQTEDNSPPLSLPESIDFPFELTLGKATLLNIAFLSKPDTELFLIDALHLSATATKQAVTLADLHINSPVFTLKGDAHLTTADDYPLQGVFDWSVPIPQYPTMSGHTELSGNLRALNITQSLTEPYNIHGSALLKEPLANLEFETKITGKSLHLQKVDPNLPPIFIQFTATGKGVPKDITFTLDGMVEDPELGPFNTTIDGEFAANKITLNRLKVTAPDQPFEIEGNGQIELTNKVDLDIVLNWKKLQWPLTKPEILSPAGKVTVTGLLDDYTVELQTDIHIPEQTGGSVVLIGQGNQQSLTLSQIKLYTLEGQLNGTAGIRWQPQFQGSLNLVGNNLNPGVLFKEWPGKLDIDLETEVEIRNTFPVVRLHKLYAAGQLREHELSLDGAIDYREKRAEIQKMSLSFGPTQLQVAGSIGDILDVDWKIDNCDLATLLPKAKGQIVGKGTLQGSVEKPSITALLDAHQLSYPGYNLQSLNLNTTLDWSGEKTSAISLNLEKGQVEGFTFNTIVLNGKGTPKSHSLTLTADSDDGKGDIVLSGTLEDNKQSELSWDFGLDQLTLKYPGLDSWTLQSPSSGTVSPGHFALSQSCMQSKKALVCLNGEHSNGETRAKFDLKELPFSLIRPHLPNNIDITGSIDGNGSIIHKLGHEPAIAINIDTSEIQLLTNNPKEKEPAQRLIVAFQPGEIKLHMSEKGGQAKVDLPLSEKNGLSLRATVSPGTSPFMERQLTGRLATTIDNLEFLQDLIPDLEDINGTLKGHMDIAGTVGAPILNGSLALTEGTAQLLRPGLDLRDINVRIISAGDSGIELAASALSKDGKLNLEGKANLLGKEPVADISIKGDNFRLINTLEAQVDTSPDLSIKLYGNRLDVEGNVTIPEAYINLKTLPESAVHVSKDQIVIEHEGQSKTEKDNEQEIYAKVRIILQDKVHFQGLGLRARVKGNILAIEKPGTPTTGSGELKILDGEYRAYGQGLVIENGQILFAGGPINHPGIDIRAVRRPTKNISVGVHVKGNLNQPDFTLYSSPEMSQGDQLSYLMLGRAMSSSSTNEGSALTRAALALGLQGGNYVAAKIGDKLGLDEFGVAETEAGSKNNPTNASFVIGKYLSPSLYVSYGLGIFKPVSTLRLQYTINKNWEFVTESSNTASGGDIIYTIESGE